MFAIQVIEIALFLFMTLCYSYQIVYILYMLFAGRRAKPETADIGELHRFGIVISARNEESVIGHLIDSIQKQNYPKELLRIYVIADNCTDSTAEICRNMGAIVYERFNDKEIGKGYALNYLFTDLLKTDDFCEGYIILDADNLLDSDYVYQMNRTFNLGYRVITSYRNSKNYGANWISAGYSLWFLREAEYLNNARMQLGTSCAISGTGFLIRRDIVEENNGWPYHLLTEDIQFTAASVIKGEKIGYSARAVLYDEQPESFMQSWRQRMRWAKGFYQVVWHYGWKLFTTAITKGSFSCYDILMTIFPAIFITATSIVCFFIKVVNAFLMGAGMWPVAAVCLQSLLFLFIFYLFIYSFGLVTVITEWKNIGATKSEKIKYTFTFPIFLFTYIPIGICALFKKVEWKPIKHSVSITVDDLKKEHSEENAENSTKK